MRTTQQNFAAALSRTRARRWRNREGGFTFVELCIGMVITTFVTAALGTFALAMGNCWRRTNTVQASSLISNQLSVRLQSRLQDSKYVGYWRAGDAQQTAGVIYWRGDLNDDLVMNYGELSVITYDSSTQSVVCYTPTVQNGDMGDEWTIEDANDPGAIERLMSGLTATPIVLHVASASLSVDHATSTTINPTLTWNVQLMQSDGSTEQTTVSSTLRAPATPVE